MAPLIEIQGLVKRFGSVVALDGLDLTVLPGEVHGFLGPNGAGKSTTLRSLLEAAAHPGWAGDRVRARPLARRRRDPPPGRLRAGDVSLWPNLSGGETIDLLLRMRDVRPDPARRADLLERFELDPTKKGRAYSKGNRQKVALVAAFAGPADLLVLDEPTSGLDPLMEQVFNDCLAEHRADGATVLLSSHILSEVEALADRVTIIREGRAVESGSLAELRHLRRSRVHAEITGGLPDLAGLPGLHDLALTDHTVTCTVDPDGLPGLLTALGAAGVRSLSSAPPRSRSCSSTCTGARRELAGPPRRHGAPGAVRAAPGPAAGLGLGRPARAVLLRLGSGDRHAVPDAAGPGAGRRADQLQPGGGGAVRPDPRRHQPG
ncbi:MAG: ABC transporter ATP-binding protein [Nocardioides sp.]